VIYRRWKGIVPAAGLLGLLLPELLEITGDIPERDRIEKVVEVLDRIGLVTFGSPKGGIALLNPTGNSTINVNLETERWRAGQAARTLTRSERRC
jgi:hypothetical protein